MLHEGNWKKYSDFLDFVIDFIALKINKSNNVTMFCKTQYLPSAKSDKLG